MGDITALIHQTWAGDHPAFDSLFQALYPELRRDGEKARLLLAHALQK